MCLKLNVGTLFSQNVHIQAVLPEGKSSHATLILKLPSTQTDSTH